MLFECERKFWFEKLRTIVVLIFILIAITTCGESEDTLTARTIPLSEFDDGSVIERFSQILHARNSDTKSKYYVFSKDRQNRIFDSVVISDLYMLIPDLGKGTDFANVNSGDIT